MSETREQFRRRLIDIGFRSQDNHTPGDWLTVKESVYAQALRDVMEAVGHYPTGDGDITTVADEIHAWAYNDLGIDLGGGDQ